MDAPTCPLCRIRTCDPDSEGPSPRDGVLYYSYTCTTCTLLSGYRDHSHTYYPSPAQVAAGTWEAGHSWRTSVLVRPLWEDGEHIGFRCTEFDECGWEQRFTAAERERCGVHDYPMGVCVNYREHRLDRGEAEGPHGYITDFGKQEHARRSDAANWDPGRYIAR